MSDAALGLATVSDSALGLATVSDSALGLATVSDAASASRSGFPSALDSQSVKLSA